MSRNAVVNRAALPALFPTHAHPPGFWDQLGRTIATFGFLEEVLGKAIFAFTATKDYSEEAVLAALEKWPDVLERALTDTLYPLAETYGKAVRDHQGADFKNVNELVDDIKGAAEIRNALCHGSWRTPDADGTSELFHFSRKAGKFETRIDCQWLGQLQAHVANLICTVIDSVTVMGLEFPGGAGPGDRIWPN